MQESFAFVTHDVAAWRDRLVAVRPIILPDTRRSPIGQLVKSMISARTRDAVSLAAYRRLGARYGSPNALACAQPDEVEKTIHDVTFADAKAAFLIEAMKQIAAYGGGFALQHLADRPLVDALNWLERLPGVARKVSASTLNASTLARPVFIVDTHVLRVLHRLRFVPPTTDYRTASEVVTAAMAHWSADDFLTFHIAMKQLGQNICRWDVPLCELCTLADNCPSNTPPA